MAARTGERWIARGLHQGLHCGMVMGFITFLSIAAQIFNVAMAEPLVAKPSAAVQFQPAVPGAKAPAPAQTVRFAPAAAIQPKAAQVAAPVPMMGAPFVAAPVRRVSRSSPSSPQLPMDIGRFFNMPLGNTTEYPSRPQTDTGRRSHRETVEEPEKETPQTQTATTDSKTPAEGGAVETAQPQVPPQAQTPEPPTEQVPPPQEQAKTAEPPPTPTPPTLTKPEEKPAEFPQCSKHQYTSDPELVAKMFSSILDIGDLNRYSLRQNEMSYLAYPQLSVRTDGGAMHVLINHPMHSVDAPSRVCQSGKILRVYMDVSHDSMVAAKAGNTIVANLQRMGPGSYRSRAEGSTSTYSLVRSASPAGALASGGSVSR